MRRMISPCVVAAGEYSPTQQKYVLDRPLATNHIYILQFTSEFTSETDILSTFNSTDASHFVSSCIAEWNTSAPTDLTTANFLNVGEKTSVNLEHGLVYVYQLF